MQTPLNIRAEAEAIEKLMEMLLCTEPSMKLFVDLYCHCQLGSTECLRLQPD